jgi:hypothetical protein
MDENILVHELLISNLIQIDHRWSLFWGHFVASCSYPYPTHSSQDRNPAAPIKKSSVLPSAIINDGTSSVESLAKIETDHKEANHPDINSEPLESSRNTASPALELTTTTLDLNLSKKAHIDGFHKAKIESPSPLIDTLRELKSKISSALSPARRRRHPHSNGWTVSGGKYSRQPLLDPSQALVTNVLCDILSLVALRQRGNFYYPKGAYREWHTNRFDVHGWRMYAVHTVPSGCAVFRYLDKSSGEVKDCVDIDGCVRLFRVTGSLMQGERPLWHSISSDGDRWSMGYLLPDVVAQRLLMQYYERFHEVDRI